MLFGEVAEREHGGAVRYGGPVGEHLKEFHGEAVESVAAPADECFALLAAVDRYPLWYPDVVERWRFSGVTLGVTQPRSERSFVWRMGRSSTTSISSWRSPSRDQEP